MIQEGIIRWLGTERKKAFFLRITEIWSGWSSGTFSGNIISTCRKTEARGNDVKMKWRINGEWEW